MKRKNLLVLTLVGGIMASLLVGCGEKSSGQDGSLEIGINQYAEHPALDLVRQGFVDELGDDFKIDEKNAQADLSNALGISEKFLGDGKDLILAIGTSSAQASKQVTSELPILFSAVTDPVSSGLVDSLEEPGGNITGTSDASPIEEQLGLFKELDPSIKKVGIIYNTGESNSQVQVDMAQEIGKKLGLEIETIGVTSINDIAQATDSLIKKVDAIYTITDNMVASAINVIAEKARENKLITIGAEESHIKGGILLTNGLSYYDLGRQTGEMAREILLNRKDPANMACQYAENTSKLFNRASLESLGLDVNHPVFQDAKEIE